MRQFCGAQSAARHPWPFPATAPRSVACGTRISTGPSFGGFGFAQVNVHPRTHATCAGPAVADTVIAKSDMADGARPATQPMPTKPAAIRTRTARRDIGHLLLPHLKVLL